jgi:PilZ domain
MLAHSPRSFPGAPSAPLVRSLRLLTPSTDRSAHEVMPANRRREVRRSGRFSCRVRRVDNLRLVADRTLDLSPEGMLVLSDEPLEHGDRLVISFQATEPPIWLGAMATVARVVAGRRPGDAGRALGLSFGLPAVSRLILRGHLCRLPPMSAHRQPPAAVASKDPDYAQIVKDIWYGSCSAPQVNCPTA